MYELKLENLKGFCESYKVLTLSLLASCAIAALITAVLINAPQYRVNVINGHMTLTK